MNDKSLIAEGWATLTTTGFTGLIGPFWTKGKGPDRQVGLIADERHCNSHLGSVHGGVLMTFSDVGLGFGVVDELGGPCCATAQIQLQFVSSARVGDLLICKPELIRRSKELVFMRGLICVEDKVVASADGIWKVISPQK